MKECRSCKEVKPLDMFSRDKSRSDGYHSYCKSCRASKESEARKSTREGYREKRLDYYLKNREYLIEKASKWNKENKSRRDEISRKSREKNYLNNKNRYYLKTYGISYDSVLSMLENQNNQCILCKIDLDINTCVVDHCHDTGRVRGCLCQTCNKRLGHYEAFLKYLTIDEIESYRLRS